SVSRLWVNATIAASPACRADEVGSPKRPVLPTRSLGPRPLAERRSALPSLCLLHNISCPAILHEPSVWPPRNRLLVALLGPDTCDPSPCNQNRKSRRRYPGKQVPQQGSP